jgi:hypothetical protein
VEEEISYQQVVETLAPCGIDCERCVRYRSGSVKRLATELGQALQGFERMASKSADRVPALRDYDRFAEVLAFFQEADCAGCREGGCPLPFCAARDCFREKGVDFCFQCDEYPCGRNQYPEMMAERWRAINDRMRDAGPERYYLESLEKPRY